LPSHSTISSSALVVHQAPFTSEKSLLVVAAASRLCWQTEQPMIMPGEVALEAAHRLDATLALGFLASEVGTGLGVDPATCDRNDVKCAVELAVAAAV
jgi:hypothetical protein